MTAAQQKTDSTLRSSEGAKHGWSPERRARHAAAIQKWKPWAKSTGPRTASGKAIAAQNAYKHGMRSARQRLVNEALSAQRACLRLADLFRRVRKLNPPNELLARIRSRFALYDRIFHTRLYQALHHRRLCKKLAFSPPMGQIVNANDND